MALAAMGLAWGTFYVLNGAFVSMLVSIREGIPPYRVLRFLRVGRSVEFILTYLGYGIFALVLARLFREIGPWSVVLFLVPLLVAHVALVRAEKLFGMARTLQDRERLLELLSNRMVEERRDERLRIASDLHDDVLQDMTRIWMQAGFARQQGEDEGDLARDLRQLVDDSQRALDSLRSVISDLKHSPLGRGGLIQTVDQLVRDLRLDWGKRVEFHPGTLDPSELSPDTQLVAYQVVREGLVNALKHSQASSIEAEIRMTHAYLRVTIRDDGIGFDPAEVDTSRHFGLGLMQERLRLSGTQLSIRTRPGGGCEIEADLPLDR
jgi:signal transduction histidine kinase